MRNFIWIIVSVVLVSCYESYHDDWDVTDTDTETNEDTGTVEDTDTGTEEDTGTVEDTDTGTGTEDEEINWDDYLANDPLSNDCAEGPLDELAQCITDSGAYLFGVSWDIHAERQRLLFNRSVDKLKYINCDDENGEIIDLCQKLGIKYSPTWVLGNGNMVVGVNHPQTVTQMAGCEPANELGEEYEIMAKENLAKALTDAGAALHEVVNCGTQCQLQRQAFGEAIDFLDIRMCDTEENPWQLSEECQEMEIGIFPTWIFPDGSRIAGPSTLTNLASKIGYNAWPEWGGG